MGRLNHTLRYMIRLIWSGEPEFMLLWRHPWFTYHLGRMTLLARKPVQTRFEKLFGYFLFWLIVGCRLVALGYVISTGQRAYLQYDRMAEFLAENHATVEKLLSQLLLTIYCPYLHYRLFFRCDPAFWTTLHRLTSNWTNLGSCHQFRWHQVTSRSTPKAIQSKLSILIVGINRFYFGFSILIAFHMTLSGSLLVARYGYQELSVLGQLLFRICFQYQACVTLFLVVFGVAIINSVISWRTHEISRQLRGKFNDNLWRHLSHYYQVHHNHAHLVNRVNQSLMSALSYGHLLEYLLGSSALLAHFFLDPQINFRRQAVIMVALGVQTTFMLMFYVSGITVNRLFATRGRQLHSVQLRLRTVPFKIKFETFYQVMHNGWQRHGYTIGPLGLASWKHFFDMFGIYMALVIYYSSVIIKRRIGLQRV